MKEYKLVVADDGTATLTLIPPPPRFVPMRGCNLAGGEFYYPNIGAAGPVSGSNYQFPKEAMVDTLIAEGMNTFRLLFSWEGVQHMPYAVLDTLPASQAAYLAALEKLTVYITGKGANVILDIHGGNSTNFAAYKGVMVGGTVGGQKIEDMLANLWRQLATRHKANPRVMYGITNEPQGIPAATWFTAAQKCIDAIRSTGSTQTIVMPGTDWTAASSWMDHNAGAWNLKDPANNLQVQLHLYLDADASGRTLSILSDSIAVERLAAATVWARSKGLKLFLGEVGMAASNPLAKAAWTKLHAFMLTNLDVISGWCFWSAGDPAWWGGYQFYCGPGSAQLDLIRSSLK